MSVTCTCTGKVLAVPTPCPVHWPEGVVKLMEAGAAKANAKGVSMLSREQFEAIKAEVQKLKVLEMPEISTDGATWNKALDAAVAFIGTMLVMKVEVAPTATATGTLEGLDGLGRRVGEG